MAKATLHFNKPITITEMDVDMDENSLKAVGFISINKALYEIAKLTATDDGMVKIVEVIRVLNNLSNSNSF